jgi:hypothetical protein
VAHQQHRRAAAGVHRGVLHGLHGITLTFVAIIGTWVLPPTAWGVQRQAADPGGLTGGSFDGQAGVVGNRVVANVTVAQMQGAKEAPVGDVVLPRQASGPRWICRFYLHAGPSGGATYEDDDGTVHKITDPVTPRRGGSYLLICRDEAGNDVYRNEDATYDPGNPEAMFGTAGDLAAAVRRARAAVKIDDFELVTSPPRSRPQLVGVKTWFWLNRTLDGELKKNEPAGPYTVTVTAGDPVIEIDPGDGSGAFECRPDQAVAWGSGFSDTKCGHVYRTKSSRNPAGHFPVKVTIRYRTASWRATGPNGTIDGYELDDDPVLTAAFPILVEDAQAVIR